MKIINKNTGEILPINQFISVDLLSHYKSLKDFTEEWEDYEEPKEYWFVEYDGRIHKEDYPIEEEYKDMVTIGNYFETNEEAEKALEKLKALKRLKDNGFKFTCWSERTDWFSIPETPGVENLKDITAYFPIDKTDEFRKDLDLLFGGEE